MKAMFSNLDLDSFQGRFSQTKIFSEFLSDHLEPKLLTFMKMDSLKQISKSFIDPKFEKSRSDLLFEIELGSKTAFIHTIFVNEKKPDSLMPLYILKSMCGIWNDHIKNNPSHKKIPVVLSILLSSCGSQWNVSLEFHDIIYWTQKIKKHLADNTPNFQCKLVDIFQ